jgi:hypothetical protein
LTKAREASNFVYGGTINSANCMIRKINSEILPIFNLRRSKLAFDLQLYDNKMEMPQPDIFTCFTILNIGDVGGFGDKFCVAKLPETHQQPTKSAFSFQFLCLFVQEDKKIVLFFMTGRSRINSTRKLKAFSRFKTKN